MYPIANPYLGQRVSVFNAGLGHITQVRKDSVDIRLDSGARVTTPKNSVTALIPFNEDGFFDGPPGYFAAT